MKQSDFQQCLDGIHNIAGRLGHPLKIMEVCGTHTVTACRSGLRTLLPENLKLLSGPGCPVCVTPEGYIDNAIRLARIPEIWITTFGDLLRVPGSEGTLEMEKAKGAGIKIVYSVLDALEMAEKQKDKKVVFLAVGFETTAPGIAWAVQAARSREINNFYLLTALKTMPHAMAALLEDGGIGIDGFICPGHVSAVIGSRPYEFIARQYKLPCVVAGFETYDMLRAIAMLLTQIAAGKHEVQNEYRRAVSKAGNLTARRLLEDVFEPCDAEWRGLGNISGSGLKLKKRYDKFDAGALLPGVACPEKRRRSGCLCGEVLRGRIVPTDCRLFGKQCTPATPVGACMVSSEGACAAYYKYDRKR